MGESSCNTSYKVDWPRYISKMIYPPKYGKAITKEIPLNWFGMATCNDYLKELRSLVNASGNRTVANYLGWRYTDIMSFFVEFFSILSILFH